MHNQANDRIRWAPAALVAAGMVLGGFFVGRGFSEARQADRYVTVKGVAEREVEADLAVWNIQLTAGGNDLRSVQRTIAGNVDLTLEFLERYGISRAQASVATCLAQR